MLFSRSLICWLILLILYWSWRFFTFRKSASLLSYCWKLLGIWWYFCEDEVRLVLLRREPLKKWDWERRVSVVNDWGLEIFIYFFPVWWLAGQLDKLWINFKWFITCKLKCQYKQQFIDFIRKNAIQYKLSNKAQNRIKN